MLTSWTENVFLISEDVFKAGAANVISELSLRSMFHGNYYKCLIEKGLKLSDINCFILAQNDIECHKLSLLFCWLRRLGINSGLNCLRVLLFDFIVFFTSTSLNILFHHFHWKTTEDVVRLFFFGLQVISIIVFKKRHLLRQRKLFFSGWKWDLRIHFELRIQVMINFIKNSSF